MKIGLVCPYNMFKGGGVQEVVAALQAGLTAKGYEAKIITPMPRDYDGPLPDPDTMIMIGGSTDVKSPFQHTTAQLSASVDTDALETMLEKEKFDVLHFHEPWVPIMSWQLLTRSNAINIASFHAKLPETVMSRTIERVVTPYTKSVIKYLDCFTAVSDAAAMYVKSLSDAPIHYIPNGVDLSRYTPATQKKAINPDKKTILYVGRLEKRKGIHYLLLAYEELVKRVSDVQLVIAGAGPQREQLEDEVAMRELPNVTFKGFVSQDEKLELLQHADLFCSPAPFGESFGIVLLEAMATGLVTIAGDNPGYNSVMRERGSISIVDPKDTANFARRLELLLYDEELRTLWRTWAESYVRQFDYTKIVDQYIDIYKKTVAQTHKSDLIERNLRVES